MLAGKTAIKAMRPTTEYKIERTTMYSYDRTGSQAKTAIKGPYVLDLNHLTSNALSKLTDLDESLIGTPDYMGIAMFWDIQYKYVMREVSIADRRKVHHALLQAHLKVNGESREIAEVIAKTTGAPLKELMDV
jgi:hypothetical protein